MLADSRGVPERLPFPAVDNASKVEARGDEGYRGDGNSLKLFDQLNGVLVQLLESSCLPILDAKVVRKGKDNVRRSIQRDRLPKEGPVELGDPPFTFGGRRAFRLLELS